MPGHKASRLYRSAGSHVKMGKPCPGLKEKKPHVRLSPAKPLWNLKSGEKIRWNAARPDQRQASL